MSRIGGYTNRSFSESQKFLVLDPATGTTSLVLGSDLVSYITPRINSVISESTRLAAENTDYAVGEIIQTSGATSPGDNFAAVYLVVAAGEGDFPMINGNELLVIRGDEFLREQLIEDPSVDGNGVLLVNGAVQRVSSRTEMKAYDVPAGYQFSLEEGGRSGKFVVKSGTPPSDPQEGIYVVLANGNYAERVYVGAVQLEWFGAIADGVFDCGTAANAALTFLDNQSGGTLLLGVGTYATTTEWTVPEGVIVRGVSRESSTIAPSDCTALKFVSFAENISVVDLYISGNSSVTSDHYGIRTENNPRGIQIVNVKVRGMGRDGTGGGIYVDGGASGGGNGWGALIDTCLVENSGKGFFCRRTNSILITNCIARQLSGIPLHIQTGGVGAVVVGGTYEKNDSTYGSTQDYFGVLLENCKLTSLIGVYAEQTTDSLVKIKDSEGVNLQRCFLNGIQGNTFPSTGMLDIENSNLCFIEGCEIDGLDSRFTGKANINLDATSENNLIQHNSLEPSGTFGGGGTGNQTIKDATVDGNFYVLNICPLTDPVFAPFQGVRFLHQDLNVGDGDFTGTTANLVDAELREDVIGTADTLRLRNRLASSDSRGNRITFETGAGRQATISSVSKADFGRNPQLLFENENDGGGLVPRFSIDPTGDVELYTDGRGVILSSPDGTRYKVAVDNAGNLVTAAA